MAAFPFRNEAALGGEALEETEYQGGWLVVRQRILVHDQ